MTDYLGPLTLGTSGTYVLEQRQFDAGSAELTIRVRGTTADTLAAAIEALSAACTAGNTLTHVEPGVTSPVVYRVTACAKFAQHAQVTWMGFWQRIDVGLTVAPFPAGALSVIYSAEHVDAPDALDLSALLGTRPTTLDVTVDDDSGNDMHSVWVALAPRVLTADQTIALTRAHWMVLASSLTWTTMSNGTGATMWGNTSRYTISSSYQSAPLDTQGYPAGKYKLLVRVSQEAGTGYVMDSVNQDPVAVTRATQHLLELGDIDLPVANTSPGTASNLTLYVRSDGTNDCIVNAFVLLPLEHGLFAWHHDDDDEEIDQLDMGPSGMFMDGVASLQYLVPADILHPRTLAAHTGTLVATPEPTASTWPADWGRTDAVDVTADSGLFKVVTTTGEKYATYAATVAGTPLVVPGTWYEFSCTLNVTARAAGYAVSQIRWLDVDGNVVRDDELDSSDGAPAASTPIAYREAPAHAVHAQVRIGAGPGASLTAYWSDVVFKRCPLQLCILAEDAAGALVTYLHPVHVTVKYTPRYEVAR